MYGDLKFVIQDRPPVIEQAKAIWAAEYPQALSERVTLMPHDFFVENPVHGAEVYLLRYILYVWHLRVESATLTLRQARLGR